MWLLVLLVSVSLAIRLLSFRFHPVIEGDGIHYANLAREILSENSLTAGLNPYLASIYQYLVAGLAWFLGDIHQSGKLVSAVFGALLVIPMFLLGSALFTKTVGYIAALLAVCHQVLINFSGMLFTESTLLFFLVTAFWSSWLAITTARLAPALLAATAFGVAASIHPQGLGYVSVLVAGLAVTLLAAKTKQKRLHVVGVGAASILVFGMVVALFAAPVYTVTGQTPWASKTLPNLIFGENMDERNPARIVRTLWTIDGPAQSPDAEQGETSALSYILNHPVELANRVYRNLGTLDREVLMSAIRPSQLSGAQALFFGLVVLGLFGMAWNRQTAQAQAFLCWIVAYNFLSNALFFFHDRLLLPVLPVFLVWAAVGVVNFGNWLGAIVSNLQLRRVLPRRHLRMAGWAALLLLLAVFVLNYFRLQPELVSQNLVRQRDVGSWMQENLPQTAVLMTDNPVTPYYFYTEMRQFVMTPYASYEQMVAYARNRNVNYILLSDWVTRDWDFPYKDLLRVEPTDVELELVHEWNFDDGLRARLFALQSQ